MELSCDKSTDKSHNGHNGISTNVKTNDKTKLLSDQKAQEQTVRKSGTRIYIAIIIVCGCVIFTLLMLNVWQAGYFDSSESESYIVECSGNGHKFNDVNKCECYSCYSGINCETETADCMIPAGSGNPRSFTEYWSEQKRKQNLKPLEIEWDYRLGYQNLLQAFSETDENGLGGEVNQIIRRIHDKYHNVNTTNSFLVIGAGATHLETAAYYAWSKIKGKPMIAYDEIPYYFGYRASCAAAGPSQCIWNATFPFPFFDQDDVIEFITTPNNPDGFIRERTYKNATSWAHDLVYYWPHYFDSADELELLDSPVSFFSLTKLSGHAGTRFGWAFVKNKTLANAMVDYISYSLMSFPVETVNRAYQILRYLEENGDEYFDHIKSFLRNRWDVLLDILEGQENYVLRSRVGTFFGWIECVNKTEEQIMAIFNSYNLNPTRGSAFGAPGFVRLGIAGLPTPLFDRMVVQFRLLVENEM